MADYIFKNGKAISEDEIRKDKIEEEEYRPFPTVKFLKQQIFTKETIKKSVGAKMKFK